MPKIKNFIRNLYASETISSFQNLQYQFCHYSATLYQQKKKKIYHLYIISGFIFVLLATSLATITLWNLHTSSLFQQYTSGLVNLLDKTPFPLYHTVQKQIQDFSPNPKNITILSEKSQKIQLPYLESIRIFPSPINQPLSLSLNFNNLTFLDKINQITYNYIDRKKLMLSLYNNIKLNNFKLDLFQYNNLNSKYNLNSNIQQLPICIISPYRNFVSDYGYNALYLFMSSINKQNYTNYRVYMVDDASNDNSVEYILQQARNHPKFNNRLTIVKNRQKIGALGNRDITIRNYCQPGSIILELDADDSLIGKQVFNTINRLYQKNKNFWFIYFNFLSTGYNKKINRLEDLLLEMGLSAPINPQIHTHNTYRTQINYWVTSHLKTYLRDLYLKIPINYLLHLNKYHIFATDRFNMYPIVELAGPEHTLYVDEIFYFYRFLMADSNINLCKSQFAQVKQYEARMQTPLLPIKTLNQPAKPTPHYTIPLEIQRIAVEKRKVYLQCLQQTENTKKNSFRG